MFFLLCGADYLLLNFSYNRFISYRLPLLTGLAETARGRLALPDKGSVLSAWIDDE